MIVNQFLESQKQDKTQKGNGLQLVATDIALSLSFLTDLSLEMCFVFFTLLVAVPAA